MRCARSTRAHCRCVELRHVGATSYRRRSCAPVPGSQISTLPSSRPPQAVFTTTTLGIANRGIAASRCHGGSAQHHCKYRLSSSRLQSVLLMCRHAGDDVPRVRDRVDNNGGGREVVEALHHRRRGYAAFLSALLLTAEPSAARPWAACCSAWTACFSLSADAQWIAQACPCGSGAMHARNLVRWFASAAALDAFLRYHCLTAVVGTSGPAPSWKLLRALRLDPPLSFYYRRVQYRAPCIRCDCCACTDPLSPHAVATALTSRRHLCLDLACHVEEPLHPNSYTSDQA